MSDTTRTGNGTEPQAQTREALALPKTGEVRSCVWCGGEFYAPAWSIRRGEARFCSRSCAGKSSVRNPLVTFHSSYMPVPFSGCWLWTGSLNRRGYGVICIDSVNHFAHRYSLILASGHNSHLHALHRCDVPACVNPDHLFWGTDADNMADAAAKGRTGNRFQASKTHCKRGHKYTPENTRITSGRWPQRVCIACSRIAGAKYDTHRRRQR